MLLRLLDELGQRNALDPWFGAQIRAALDADEAPPDAYPGGFEELRGNLERNGSLTASEQQQLLQAIRAGIGAARRFRRGSPDVEPIFVEYFRKRVHERLDVYDAPFQGELPGLPGMRRENTGR